MKFAYLFCNWTNWLLFGSIANIGESIPIKIFIEMISVKQESFILLDLLIKIAIYLFWLNRHLLDFF